VTTEQLLATRICLLRDVSRPPVGGIVVRAYSAICINFQYGGSSWKVLLVH